MLAHIKITNKIFIWFGSLIQSHISKQTIQIGSGSELATDKSLVFCHGKGGTPFIYTQYLIHYAESSYKVGFVQHSEVNSTSFTDRKDIKGYR